MRGISIEFDNHLINVVLDRFGLKARIKPIDGEGKFLLEIEGIVSMGFRWLLTWGADAKVIRPESLIDLMKIEISKYKG